MIKIDSHIPFPDDGKSSKYPWRELQVGQSFVYDGNVINAQQAALYHSRRKSKTFKASTLRNEVRVWRTA